MFVYAVDRLGQDAIDVQQTIRDLIGRGVAVHVHGLGTIAKGVGELILAVLAQVAAMVQDCQEVGLRHVCRAARVGRHPAFLNS
jgi:hypothetical protein